MSSKTVLITGATSGIGKATAELLAQKGYRLILTGRRADRLHHLKEILGKFTEVWTLNFDVRDRSVIPDELRTIPESFLPIDVLINNAGNAYGMAPIHEGDEDDWDHMIDINLKGLLNVTRQVVPKMVERKSGQVINIASLAGRETYPNGNVYCASKHAVVALSEGMRKDLNPYGIKVTSIDPGLVETEFSDVRFHGDSERAQKVYEGYTPLRAEDVAETIEFVLSRPAHVNIADMLVLCTDQASSTIVRKD